MRALALGRRHGVDELKRSLPISVIGTGPDLNSATDNGLARAAELLAPSVLEIKSRATISGRSRSDAIPGWSR
jgi:formamidase